jgi:hypothetical protein
MRIMEKIYLQPISFMMEYSHLCSDSSSFYLHVMHAGLKILHEKWVCFDIVPNCNHHFHLHASYAGLKNLEVIHLGDNPYLDNATNILSCLDGLSSLKSLSLSVNLFDTTSSHSETWYSFIFYFFVSEN